MFKHFFTEGDTVDDVWFNLLKGVTNPEYTYRTLIDKGSFERQHTRVQFYDVNFIIRKPWGKVDTPDRLIVTVPAGVPHPCSIDFLDDYFCNNFFNPDKPDINTDYTYGERIFSFGQVGKVMDMLKDTPYTNQAVIRVSAPSDVNLKDPPCLVIVKFTIIENTLNVHVTFRSWDLVAGWPGNIGAIQMMKEFIAAEVGLEDGVIAGNSGGLHIYDYQEDIVASRVGKKRWEGIK